MYITSSLGITDHQMAKSGGVFTFLNVENKNGISGCFISIGKFDSLNHLILCVLFI